MSFPSLPDSPTRRSSKPLSPAALTQVKQPSADGRDSPPPVHSRPSSTLGKAVDTQRVSKSEHAKRSHRADASVLSPSRGTSAEREPQTPFQAARDSYGTTLAKLKGLPGAFYAPSASAGLALNGLNDHDGVLIVPANDGDSVVAERFAVVKQNVGGEDRYFVKGHGDFAVPFEAFEKALAAVNDPDKAKVALRQTELEAQLRAALKTPSYENPMLETPLRSEVLALSASSDLGLRRDEKESDDVLMPRPLNPTPFPKKVSWANSENALCPGCGPVLANGTRLYQLDWNRVENRLMGFKNNNGGVDRQDSILADTVKGHKAPVLVDGPVMFELSGIRRWQLIGPANEQSGAKGGAVSRLGSAAGQLLKSSGGHGDNATAEGTLDQLDTVMHKLKPGAQIRITTEDGAVHDLMLTEKGMSLSLAKTTAGPGGGDHKAALGVGMDIGSIGDRKDAEDAPVDGRLVKADVNVYSYQGRYTGRHSTSSGLPDPQLVLSTGERLKAGPLMNHTNDAYGMAQALGRLVLYKPNLGGPGGGSRARLVNVLLLALAKFGTTALSAMADHAMRGKDGVHIDGATRFSGVGSGEASIGTLAGSTALIVLSQELVTALKDTILPAIPEAWQNPSNDIARNALTLVSTGFEEMLRLEINLGLQKALGLREGSGWDHATLAISSGLKALLETVRDNIGGPEARPYAHMVLDAVQSLQYMLLRVTGMVMSEPPGEAGRLTNFNEAARTRVNLRLYDQVLAPVFSQLLNSQGIVGENANPFDHQIARERMIERFRTQLGGALTALMDGNTGPLQEMVHDKGIVATVRANLEQVLLGGRDKADTEFFSSVDYKREHLKQMLNRLDLMASSLGATYALVGSLVSPLHGWLCGDAAEDDLEAGNPEHRVARAIEMQVLGDDGSVARRQERADHLQATSDAQGRRIESAKLLESGTPLAADATQPTTNSLSQASGAQQRFARAQAAQLQGRHEHLAGPDGSMDLSGRQGGPLRAMVPQPVSVDYAQRTRPAAGKTSTLGVPSALRDASVHKPGVPLDQPSKDVGTFSNKLQAASMPQHVPMTKAAGMKDVVKGRAPASLIPVITEPRPLNEPMRDRVGQSVRDYTVESQFFHYPLRWPVTGEPQVLNIVPGVQVRYNVLNKPGNVKGEKHQRVDPIEALYANIGCARAEKFPAELLRAVVTEAAYKPASGQTEPSGEIHAQGSKGVLTEIFSASGSDRVAAQFNLPISGFGAAPRDRSQRIDLVEETGVNVATMSDLAQAEVILMPGGVFTVRHVDPNAGKPPRAAGAPKSQDIGQVVHMEQQDTYQLERAFDEHLPYLRTGQGTAPKEGTLMVHPQTGQFMRYEKDALKEGDKLYDPASGKFVAFDAANPPPHGGFRFVDATRNYFLGKSLEYASTADQEALWRHPYTGDSAKRSTKDAIHAAILRGAASDPIVSHLNEATKNLHHEHFRKKGGFYDTQPDGKGGLRYVNPRAQAEAEATAKTRQDAATIVKANLAAKLYDKPQTPLQTEMLAWTTASMLRRPIKLMPVGDGSGLPAGGLSINETYDKVDLLKHPLDLKPDPAVVIGVGKDGYYAMRNQGGKFVATHRMAGISKGLTAENFMQAYLRAGPLDKADYTESRPTDGSQPTFVPGDRAVVSARELYAKLGTFAATDYIVLQQAMVARKAQAEARGAGGPAGDSVGEGDGDSGREPDRTKPTGPKPTFRPFAGKSDDEDDRPGGSDRKGYQVPDDVQRAVEAIRSKDAGDDAAERIFSQRDPSPDGTGTTKGKARMPGGFADGDFS
jgi:hypothetical protein